MIKAIIFDGYNQNQVLFSQLVDQFFVCFTNELTHNSFLYGTGYTRVDPKECIIITETRIIEAKSTGSWWIHIKNTNEYNYDNIINHIKLIDCIYFHIPVKK